MLSQSYNDAKMLCTFNGGKNTAFSGHETFTKILDGLIKFITREYMEFGIDFFLYSNG